MPRELFLKVMPKELFFKLVLSGYALATIVVKVEWELMPPRILSAPSKSLKNRPKMCEKKPLWHLDFRKRLLLHFKAENGKKVT